MGDILAAVIGFVLAIIVIAVIVALPVMWLWNWLMPDLFGLAEIGFWQALGLSMLSSFLFKSTSKSD